MQIFLEVKNAKLFHSGMLSRVVVRYHNSTALGKELRGRPGCIILRSQIISLNYHHYKYISIIQRYLILTFNRSSPLTSINECRRDLFTKKRRTLENIPPTEDALVQHLKWSMLQAIIWTFCLILQLPEFDFAKWGWIVDENGVHPSWTVLDEASKACIDLRKCGCKKQCNPKRCSWKKNLGLPCTQLWACDGGCYDNIK